MEFKNLFSFKDEMSDYIIHLENIEEFYDIKSDMYGNKIYKRCSDFNDKIEDILDNDFITDVIHFSFIVNRVFKLYKIEFTDEEQIKIKNSLYTNIKIYNDNTLIDSLVVMNKLDNINKILELIENVDIKEFIEVRKNEELG